MKMIVIKLNNKVKEKKKNKRIPVLHKILYRENNKMRFLWHCNYWNSDRHKWNPVYLILGLCF